MLLSLRPIESIYDIPLTAADGRTIDLHGFRGKKMLFIVLPVADTALVHDMAALQEKYATSLVIIGVPEEELGVKKGAGGQLVMLYKNMPPGFVLTEDMRVSKGAKQSVLFSWLTSKDENTHFDLDAKGVGSKFFVSESGEMYAVIGPEVKLTDPFIDKVMKR